MSDESTGLGPGVEAPQAQVTDVSEAIAPPAAGPGQESSEAESGDVNQKRIDDLTAQLNAERSRADKRIQEATERLNEQMAAHLERLASQQPDPAQAQREAEATIRELGERLNEAQEAGSSGPLIAEIIMQQSAAINAENQRKLDEQRKAFEARLQDLDPDVVSADKQKVAEYAERFHVSKKVAAGILKDIEAQVQAAKGPTQPPAQPVPGNGITAHVIPKGDDATLSEGMRSMLSAQLGTVSAEEARAVAARLAARKGNK